MRIKMAALAGCAIGTVLALAQPARLPRFEDYPVDTVYHGETLPPKFSRADRDSDSRCFGVPDGFDYSIYKPNFAGHYVIEACTCGSGCHYLYMWDAVTGKTFTSFPAMPIDVGPFFDRGQDFSPTEYKGEEYKVASSLLIIDGCIEDACDCGTRYYR